MLLAPLQKHLYAPKFLLLKPRKVLDLVQGSFSLQSAHLRTLRASPLPNATRQELSLLAFPICFTLHGLLAAEGSRDLLLTGT